MAKPRTKGTRMWGLYNFGSRLCSVHLRRREAVAAGFQAGGEYNDEALLERAEKAEARLNTNRCNSGHETLPLTLWDCPECHNNTRRERDEAKARADRLAGLLRADRQEMELLRNLLEGADADCLGDGEDDEGRAWSLRDEAIDRLSKHIARIDAELGDSRTQGDE